MFETMSDIETQVNEANQKISRSSAEFMNDLETIKEIVANEDKTRIEEQISLIDAALEVIYEIYRRHIRQYLIKYKQPFNNDN